MEGTFGAHAVGGEAVERFFVCVGEQRVEAGGDGEIGFETVGAFHVPGGEGDLAVEGSFDGASGVELESECGGEGVEELVVLFGEQDRIFGVEAELGGVGGGARFSIGGVWAGG